MDKNENSRLEKYEKRRKNSKFITYFAMIAAVLALFLIGIWVFGGGDDEAAENQNQNTNEDEGFFLEMEEDEDQSSNEEEASDVDTATNDESETDNNGSEDNGAASEQDENNQNEDSADVNIEEAEPSDDNVKEAFTGNWPPSGTEQTGPHTTVFTDGSQDRIEIKRAVSNATGLPENELRELWVGNGGDQKVIATVSDSTYTDIYRVYLNWIDNEGWQPTKIETLIEYDG